MLKIVTQNVNHCQLLAGILNFLINEKPDIIALQEVVQDTEQLQGTVSRFGYNAYAGSENGRPGVAFIYLDSLPIIDILPLAPGRLLLLHLEGCQSFMNIYAPSGNNNRQQRREFYSDTLSRNLRLRGTLPIENS